MANRTDTQADTVHGGNPQYLVDRINRVKIYNDAYWKEFCFGLTTESLIDRAIEIDYVGGTYGGRRRPAKFFCLVLKCLQIQPDEDVVMEYIKQSDYKYLRALGCIYLRITASPMTVYKTLEPLYADYRKLRFRDITGKLSIIHMDEFIDWLLREETVCEVTMPGLPRREVLEVSHDLEPRTSVLDDDLDDLEELLEQEDAKAAKVSDGKPGAVDVQLAGANVVASVVDDEPVPETHRRGLAPEARSASLVQARRSSPPRRSRSARGARGRSSPRHRSPTPAKRARRHGRTLPSRSASGGRRRSRSHSAKAKEKRDRKREEGREKDDRKEKAEKKEKKAKRLEKWQVGYGKEDLRKASNKADEQRAAGPKGKKEKDGTLSVEESNALRKKLGMKPLKE